MSIIITDSGFFSNYQDTKVSPNHPGPSVDLKSDFDPKDITQELLEARCIRIELPSFADGRAFTLAILLRSHGYTGHLRAVGYILADQYTMVRRSGFDDVEISEELAIRQPKKQWQDRADWRRHDYQGRLREQTL